ncbi:MAG: 3-oxoacyl-[acyl-carrier-protein] synthase III C-terminal domain-containing protein [Nannocystaceae bacterium]
MNVGITAVAYAVPEQVRRNDYWQVHHPELVASAGDRALARVWARREAQARNLFDEAMEPYLDDPFRGAVERRILAEGETSLSLEVLAARRALAAGRRAPGDVDLLLLTSFIPDQPGPGNAAYLVKELGLRCPGINLESACSSTLVSLNTAVGLVQAGHYRNALVVSSCCYSRFAPPWDTLSWFMGDGAGALLLGEVPEGRGWAAAQTIHTAATCGTFHLDLAVEGGKAVHRMTASQETARVINEIGEPSMREACAGALERAGIRAGDLACVVTNTPTAWYASFAAKVLGVPRDRLVSTYDRFANTGPVLIPMNLHESMRRGKLRDGDWVLLYAIGSVSTAVATVLRWSDAGLGAT